MRRMSADNHRGQEVKIFRQQAGYMRAMINSHITDRCLAKRRGPYRYSTIGGSHPWHLDPGFDTVFSNTGMSLNERIVTTGSVVAHQWF